MTQNILAIDQGTTSCRAMIFSPAGQVLSQAQKEFKQFFPANGWVEHDPIEIWQTTCSVATEALNRLPKTETVVGIGITNQRETTIVWDRRTGQPVYPAIVWQDRRTADHCLSLAADGLEEMIRKKTGLCLDAYFSASKIHWIFNYVDGVKEAAEQGHIAVGTVDSWLIWNFTQGRQHVTDATNASRTLLFNIHTQQWDEDLLRLYKIPQNCLPKVLNCNDHFGTTEAGLGDTRIPITGVAGDQQAALVGQACFTPGMIKSTYGTGCFALMNLGDQPIQSKHNMLTTVGYRINGKVAYALEGAIFSAGSSVQWLRDQLGIIQNAAETEYLAATTSSNQGVYLVPAFTGLGAPHWEPNARATLSGMTRATGKHEIVRAALESVSFQTYDLMKAMAKDAKLSATALRVDGGMANNNWFLQSLADIVNIPVQRPAMVETTALGAARLAGLGLGIYRDTAELAPSWIQERQFLPQMAEQERLKNIDGWQRAVNACVGQTANDSESA